MGKTSKNTDMLNIKTRDDEIKEVIDDALDGGIDLGGRVHIIQKGALGTECYLTFCGQKDEPLRYFELGGLSHEALLEMACVFKQLSEAMQVMEEGSEEDRQKYFMEHGDMDGMVAN